MVSLDECRKFLGRYAEALTDEDLERLRSGLYLLARMALNNAAAMQKESFTEKLSHVPERDHELIIEQAAEMEYSNRLSKEEAERLAFENYIRGQVSHRYNSGRDKPDSGGTI